jgi:hypothetical protein
LTASRTLTYRIDLLSPFRLRDLMQFLGGKVARLKHAAVACVTVWLRSAMWVIAPPGDGGLMGYEDLSRQQSRAC